MEALTQAMLVAKNAKDRAKELENPLYAYEIACLIVEAYSFWYDEFIASLDC